MKTIHLFSPANNQILNSFETIEEAVKFAKLCLRSAAAVTKPAEKFTFKIGTTEKVLKYVTINNKLEISIYS